MNKMKQVAELLGVELNERFKVFDKNFKCVVGECSITDDGAIIEDSVPNTGEYFLQGLLTGRFEVIKMPFKPKYEDIYWVVVVDENGTYLLDSTWIDDDIDYMRYAIGNCFRTREEITDEVMGKIVKEIKAKYENE